MASQSQEMYRLLGKDSMDNIIVALLISVVTAAAILYLASRTLFNNAVASDN